MPEKALFYLKVLPVYGTGQGHHRIVQTGHDQIGVIRRPGKGSPLPFAGKRRVFRAQVQRNLLEDIPILTFENHELIIQQKRQEVLRKRIPENPADRVLHYDDFRRFLLHEIVPFQVDFPDRDLEIEVPSCKLLAIW